MCSIQYNKKESAKINECDPLSVLSKTMNVNKDVVNFIELVIFGNYANYSKNRIEKPMFELKVTKITDN